jgi:hypothetical protein
MPSLLAGTGVAIAFDGGADTITLSARGAVVVTPTGAVEDGTTDDHAAFASMTIARNTSAIAGYGYSASLQRAYVPFGVSYQGTTPFDLQGGGIIEGDAGSIFSGGGSVLKWGANSEGIRVQFNSTSGDTTFSTAAGNVSASGSIIRNLTLKTTNTGTDQTKPGIRLKAPTVLEDVFIDGFAGSGVHANAQLASPGTDPNSTSAYGNVSLSQIHRCTIQGCYHGVELQGADANICTVAFSSANGNRGYGYYDNSQFGNLWLGLHSALNTLGNYHTDPSQASAHPTLVHCYSEGGGPACTFGPGTLRVGGNWNPGDTGGGYVYAAGDAVHVNALDCDGTLNVLGTTANIGPQAGSVTDTALTLDTTNTAGIFVNRYNNTSGALIANDGALNNAFGTWQIKAAGNVDVLHISSAGADLQTGKVLSVAGTQVVGPRQTGTPADATDLATALTLVNALKAKLVAHGLIS